MDPTKEYLHLFNAISKVIRALQETLLLQMYTVSQAKQAAKCDTEVALHILLEQYQSDIAALQILQKFLVKSQKEAEDIYLERTD